jgi:hypothetical protein
MQRRQWQMIGPCSHNQGLDQQQPQPITTGPAAPVAPAAIGPSPYAEMSTPRGDDARASASRPASLLEESDLLPGLRLDLAELWMV